MMHTHLHEAGWGLAMLASVVGFSGGFLGCTIELALYRSLTVGLSAAAVAFACGYVCVHLLRRRL